ncbi:MAG: ribose methyltransferase substrate binding family protein [Micavibrio sp.]|nr:ribose methyltransferase substrate binding family protein [Micavibrio sp.]
MNNPMKKTGKPPQKSSRKPAARSSDRSAGPRERSSGDKPARARTDSRPDSRPARSDARTGEKKPAGKFNARTGKKPFDRDAKAKPAHAGARTSARTTERGTDRPKRDFADRPKKDFGDRPKRAYAKKDFGDAPRRSETREARPVRDVRPTRAPREERAPREPKVSLGPRANLFGLHAVREAWLNPKRSIHAIYLTEANESQFEPVMEKAQRKGLIRPQVKILDKEDFERLVGRDTVHQGAAMSAAPQEECYIQDIISIGADKEKSVIVMLDQVTDPHNVGAILRSACAFGADGVVMQKRHAPDLDGIVAKTASGAAEHIPVAYETNLSRTLEELTEAGYTIIGLDEHSETSLSEVEVPAKAVLILGAEGDGMRRLIRDHCDVLVTLPTRLPIASLNVSNAAAVALYALLN